MSKTSIHGSDYTPYTGHYDWAESDGMEQRNRRNLERRSKQMLDWVNDELEADSSAGGV
ncbi:hypothetical protein BDV24DRAFT_122934 [Aspergillus arachidicola]|uniref:Uncharacterized protein n=1 Tax=Aspergillus arachidicola TaxID=656916 RepID=A0A5N6YQ12_9EURO|nr:hypothetical protein BDV24DRAFT_122934 [Aspergillus arachidicola]